MGIKNKYIIFVVLFSNILFAKTKVNYSVKLEKEFNRGLLLFAQHKYDDAKNIFYNLSDEKLFHQRSSASTLLFARTLTLLNKYSESNEVLKKLLQLFPETNYIVDSKITSGINFYGLKNYDKAIQKLSEVLNSEKSSEYNKIIAKNYIKEIIFYNSPFTSINNLVANLENVTPNSAELFILMQIAEKLFIENEYQKAKKIIEFIQSNTEEPLLISQSDALLQYVNRNKPVEIGVILPLYQNIDSTFLQKKIANEVKNGIINAANLHNQNSKTKIKLIIYDMVNEVKLAANQLHELSQNNNCIAILGPPFSYEMQVLSAMAQRRKINLISPTATDTGISSKGKYIFQFNYDYKTRGKLLAKYALLHLNKKNIAVLSPSSYPQRLISDIFAKEVMDGGGVIISDIRYPKGANDLRSSFRAIRTDGMMNEIDTTYMKGKRKFYIDSLNYPIKSIDLLYAPIITKEQIGVIASHLKLFNISTSILGSGEWLDNDELEFYKNNFQDIFIPNDLDSKQKLKSINFYLGFDLMSAISKLVNEGAKSRDVLENDLSELLFIEGLKGNYLLYPNNSNSSFKIIKFSNGFLQPIDEVSHFE
ncbi:MAG: ABC transporter substrate-binding protein [Bacteroidetes bacterium]|nr:ABC transporter substrate-binding protein [Bacteroidota bacterium]